MLQLNLVLTWPSKNLTDIWEHCKHCTIHFPANLSQLLKNSGQVLSMVSFPSLLQRMAGEELLHELPAVGSGVLVVVSQHVIYIMVASHISTEIRLLSYWPLNIQFMCSSGFYHRLFSLLAPKPWNVVCAFLKEKKVWEIIYMPLKETKVSPFMCLVSGYAVVKCWKCESSLVTLLMASVSPTKVLIPQKWEEEAVSLWEISFEVIFGLRPGMYTSKSDELSPWIHLKPKLSVGFSCPRGPLDNKGSNILHNCSLKYLESSFTSLSCPTDSTVL